MGSVRNTYCDYKNDCLRILTTLLSLTYTETDGWNTYSILEPTALALMSNVSQQDKETSCRNAAWFWPLDRASAVGGRRPGE